MAAHICYTKSRISAEQLSPAQMFFIALVEDARIEYKAIKDFPGLKKLWRSLLVLDYQEPTEHDTIPILERFALQLLDSSYQSE